MEIMLGIYNECMIALRIGIINAFLSLEIKSWVSTQASLGSRRLSDKACVTLDTIKGNSVRVCAQALVCVFFWVTSASFTEVKWGQI